MLAITLLPHKGNPCIVALGSNTGQVLTLGYTNCGINKEVGHRTGIQLLGACWKDLGKVCVGGTASPSPSPSTLNPQVSGKIRSGSYPTGHTASLLCCLGNTFEEVPTDLATTSWPAFACEAGVLRVGCLIDSCVAGCKRCCQRTKP